MHVQQQEIIDHTYYSYNYYVRENILNILIVLIILIYLTINRKPEQKTEFLNLFLK